MCLIRPANVLLWIFLFQRCNLRFQLSSVYFQCMSLQWNEPGLQYLLCFKQRAIYLHFICMHFSLYLRETFEYKLTFMRALLHKVYIICTLYQRPLFKHTDFSSGSIIRASRCAAMFLLILSVVSSAALCSQSLIPNIKKKDIFSIDITARLWWQKGVFFNPFPAQKPTQEKLLKNEIFSRITKTFSFESK